MKNVSQRAAVVALVLGILAVPVVVLASTALFAAGSSPTKELATTLAESRSAAVEQPVTATAVEEPAVAAGGAVVASDETAPALISGWLAGGGCLAGGPRDLG